MIEPITFLGIGIFCGGLIVWPLILRWTERLTARRLEAALPSLGKASTRSFEMSVEQPSDKLTSERAGCGNHVNQPCLPMVDFGASTEPPKTTSGPMFLPLTAVQRDQLPSIEMDKSTAQIPSPPIQPLALSSRTLH
jgi:hypothetical protein